MSNIEKAINRLVESEDFNDMIEEIIEETLQEKAQEIVKENYTPDDLYTLEEVVYDFEDDLQAYFSSRYSPDEMFPEEELYRTVNAIADPEDVFDEDDLRKWAEDHGYKLVEKE